jgi:hypothetical protein
MGEPKWVKRFTARGATGTYLRVVVPGEIRAGDRIEVIRRPRHTVTIGRTFRALTTQAELLPACWKPVMTSRRRNARPSCAAPADSGRAAPLPAGVAPYPPLAAPAPSLTTADRSSCAHTRRSGVAMWS